MNDAASIKSLKYKRKTMLSKEDKQKIADALRMKMDTEKLSQKVVERASGVSLTNVNHIFNGKWYDKVIGDIQWIRIAEWLGIALEGESWVLVNTKNFKRITNMCVDAQRNGIMYMISGKQGSGKSASLRNHTRNNSANTFYIECHAHWGKKDFLNELKKRLGLDVTPESINDMVTAIVNFLKKTIKPLVIIDEADELKEGVFGFIKSLYNLLDEHCGFIICGGLHLRKRMDKGVKLAKQSYCEIFSRCGGEMRGMHEITEGEIEAICKANGLIEGPDVQEVINSANNDLRRVERRIHSIKLLKQVA